MYSKGNIMKGKKSFLFFYFILVLTSNAQDKIQLEGEWSFAVDSLDLGVKEKWLLKSFDETIYLPGSMAENGKGNEISLSTKWTGDIIDSSFFKSPSYEKYRKQENLKVPFWLQPVKHYIGASWYKYEIEIPSEWNDKAIELLFERCHWQSALWIDEDSVGSQNSLGAPHKFDLTGKISPGRHIISVRVDNRIKDINPGENSHSLTDHTQTNWNGIVGEISITARNKIHFKDIRIFPDVNQKKAKVELHINNLNVVNKKVNVSLQALPEGNALDDLSFSESINEIELEPGENLVAIEYDMKDALLWDEFNPNLYKLICKISEESVLDTIEEIFGLRKIGTKGTQFTINDKLTFLRGTLECAIFPKTGYPPVDVNEWKRIFSICKSYGLNHVRFHSWCPPEAAFIAADMIGIYLQIECSSWANQGVTLGDGKPIDQYIYDESERIVKEFGNHPSFCFMMYGNEPAGDNQQKYLSEFVTYWKEKDNRRLYSGGAGWPILDEDDFHSMYEPRIQLWGAGLESIINSEPPRSDYDWQNIIDEKTKPIISHEIGQWCVYPNFNEINKYDGVLKARNFEIFKDRLTENGMIQLADSFLIASGKLQVLCYKADIEAALRTKGMGGFQLLDLHDFPGQGSALVGVLDPFWEEKGYVNAAEYKQFCNSTVPLARFSKFIFNSSEYLNVNIEVSHFGPEIIKDVVPKWTIFDESGKNIANGVLAKRNLPIGNGINLGSINFSLNEFRTPAMYTLEIKIDQFKNNWDFWVYPEKNLEFIHNSDIKVVQHLDNETIDFLEQGGKVLFTPVKGSIKPEKGGNVAVGFSSIFWNTAWTLNQPPHTLGILCNPEHPMLKNFPTQYHSNFQWWDAMSHSDVILLSELGIIFNRS
jgi:hypothetical protein